jgi:hypothetical protein
LVVIKLDHYPNVRNKTGEAAHKLLIFMEQHPLNSARPGMVFSGQVVFGSNNRQAQTNRMS